MAIRVATVAMRQPVCLVDFSVFKPPENLKANFLKAHDGLKQWEVRSAHTRIPVKGVQHARYA